MLLYPYVKYYSSVLVIRLLCLHTALIFTLIKLTVVVLLERTYFIGMHWGIYSTFNSKVIELSRV